MQLPAPVAYLADEPGPLALKALLPLYGIHEGLGDEDNPIILNMARNLGIEGIYQHDATAWCGLTQAWAERRAGREPPKEFLRALAWRSYGVEVDEAMLGDRLVYEHLSKPGTGHVTMYVGETVGQFAGLGGNQGDALHVSFYTKSRKQVAAADMVLRAIRRPLYRSLPANVRRILLDDGVPAALAAWEKGVRDAQELRRIELAAVAKRQAATAEKTT